MIIYDISVLALPCSISQRFMSESVSPFSLAH